MASEDPRGKGLNGVEGPSLGVPGAHGGHSDRPHRDVPIQAPGVCSIVPRALSLSHTYVHTRPSKSGGGGGGQGTRSRVRERAGRDHEFMFPAASGIKQGCGRAEHSWTSCSRAEHRAQLDQLLTPAGRSEHRRPDRSR